MKVKVIDDKLASGFGILEIIIAVGIWVLIASIGVASTLGSLRVNRLADEEAAASLLAAEGIDAAHSIKKQGWTTPFLATNCTAGCGLTQTAGTWAYSGASNVIDKFTRKVFVEQGQRDGGGNLVNSAGTLDPDIYKVTSEVTWSRGVPPITNTISIVSYLSNFIKSIAAAVNGGILIYGNGTTSPATRAYDRTLNTFGNEFPTATASSGITFRVRTSPTKTEAVAGYVTAGGVLQIMCFDGNTWSNDWSVTVGGTGTTRRFDIAYETNSGDAMVLYSTNAGTTNELAYRTKTGASACGTGNWSAATNLNPIRTSGIIHWVKLAWDRRAGQNLIAAIWADANADLSAMIWSGSAWGNEPAAVSEASLEIVASAQDVEDFDVEYESTSGDVMVIWANSAGSATVNGVRYRLCTGGTSSCTWGAVTTPPTFANDATNLDLAANPNTDEMVFASIGNGGNDLQIGYWSGSAWTNTNDADTSCNSPAAGTQLVAAGWLISGGTTRSVIRYADQRSTAIDWYIGNVGVFTKQGDFTQSPAASNPRYFEIFSDPISQDQLMSLASGSTNQLFAKRLVMTSTPVFTWTNSDGVALTSSLPTLITNPYSFAYWRQ